MPPDAVLDEKLKSEIVKEVNSISRSKSEPLKSMLISPRGQAIGIAASCDRHKKQHGYYPKLLVECEASFILGLSSISRLSTLKEADESLSYGCKIGIKPKTMGGISKSGISQQQPLFLFVKENEERPKPDEPEAEPFKASKTTNPAQLAYHCQLSLTEKGYARVSFSGPLAASVVIKTLLQLRMDLLRTKGKDLLISDSVVASATAVNTEAPGSVVSYDITIIRLEVTDADPPRQPESSGATSTSPPSSFSIPPSPSSVNATPAPSDIPPLPTIISESPSAASDGGHSKILPPAPPTEAESTPSPPTKNSEPQSSEKVDGGESTMSISKKDWESLQEKVSLLNRQNKDLIELVTKLTREM